MKQREILFIIGSFFILVLVYLGLSIYHNYVTSTIPEDLDIQITPISPSFDNKAISDLKKRTSISPLYQTGQQGAPTVATQSGSPSARSL